MENYLVWCDIPVLNIERAREFYSKLLNLDLKIKKVNGMEMVIFSENNEIVSGCLYNSDNPISKDLTDSVLIYLNVSGRMQEALSYVKALGGMIEQDTYSIGEYWSKALIIDSEGNRIALHSR